MSKLTLETFETREAQAEKVTCLVWLAVITLTYAFFVMGFKDSVDAALARNISLLVLIMVPAFSGIAWLIHIGYYSASLKYINTFLQVTLVSGAILFDGMAQGPAYALSSMPPMAYALVPMITAFRLQPALGLFAGTVAGLEFLLLYLFLLQPSPELVQEIPSLGLEVTMMKVVVLIALGVASAFAARSLHNYFINFGESQAMQMRLERNFGRFVSPAIVEQIESSADGRVAPNQQQAAIVFGDIRGFTSYASTTDSLEVTRLLNAYFEIVCQIVEDEGGMVNKFMGDGWLAFFGIYSNDEAPCEAAARAVLKIQRQADELLKPYGLSTGAAANYGEVITGEIGSRGRCEFTAIGAPVNLTSRLEGLNCCLGTRFLVSQDFLGQISAQAGFDVAFKGDQRVKGLTDKIAVFEISD